MKEEIWCLGATLEKDGNSKRSPSQCTDARDVAMFKREYGENFIKAGVGKIILIEGSM